MTLDQMTRKYNLMWAYGIPVVSLLQQRPLAHEVVATGRLQAQEAAMPGQYTLD